MKIREAFELPGVYPAFADLTHTQIGIADTRQSVEAIAIRRMRSVNGSHH
jgi:hypothetical protein